MYAHVENDTLITHFNVEMAFQSLQWILGVVPSAVSV